MPPMMENLLHGESHPPQWGSDSEDSSSNNSSSSNLNSNSNSSDSDSDDGSKDDEEDDDDDFQDQHQQLEQRTRAASEASQQLTMAIDEDDRGSGLARIDALLYYNNNNNNNNSPDRQQQTSTLSEGAKEVLRNLLQNANVPPPRLGSILPAGITDPSYNLKEEENKKEDILECDTVKAYIPYDKVTPDLELARNGKASLFCSILRMLEDGDDDEVSTSAIIRKCCMTLQPGLVPPCTDAGEMTLAALRFLASSIPGLAGNHHHHHHHDDDSEDEDEKRTSRYGREMVQNTFPYMPLIEPTIDSLHTLSDRDASKNIEKLVYKKCTSTPNGQWTMTDDDDDDNNNNNVFRRKVLCLEKAFLSSTWKYPSRMRMIPTLENWKEQEEVMISGTLASAAAAAAMKKKAEKKDAGAKGTTKTAKKKEEKSSSDAGATASSSTGKRKAEEIISPFGDGDIEI